MEYTIVIPVYNKEEYVYRAVQSALNQTLPPASILIIDDCSTDSSMMQLEPFLGDPRLKIIQFKKNAGISKVLNKALDTITTPYFIQLDGDDWLEPQAGEKLITALHHNPSAAFAFGNHTLWTYNDQYELVLMRNMIQPHFTNKYDFLLKLGFMVNPRCYRAESIKEIGGWITDDPWEGRYLEDARMIIRLAGKFSWIHIPELLHNVYYDPIKGKKKFPIYNEVRKSFYEDILISWGDLYTPIWNVNSAQVVYLEKLVPKK
ncbi:glycosyltransferase family 2 protein [Bacillus massiliglaciei]|uniref:glycosyltransferase family 2 protein n=1 Tax=Bacillus massiliglaciei TaxID=1816693 RepID=UPI000DA607F3|nr:glycosyltransferase family A protein [Bacillus massiliglaciei]